MAKTMPTSTVPNTPAKHKAGVETLLSSPQTRARSRWLGFASHSPGGLAEEAVNHSGDDEEAKLLAEPAPGNNSIRPTIPESQRKSRNRFPCMLLLLVILIVLGVLFLKDERKALVADWFDQVSSTYLADEADRPYTRKQWTYVTGTSPFAVERGCVRHSAHRIHDSRVLGVETLDSIVNALKRRHERGESLVTCGPPPMDLASLRKSYMNVIVYFENGVQAAFDPSFALWARARGMDVQIEERIDESCLARRIKTRRKHNCIVTEIGILRAAEIWSKIGEEAISVPTFTVESIDDLNEPVIEHMRTNGTLHRILLNQLLQSHLRHPEGKTISFPLGDAPDLPETPVAPWVDAGYCQVIYKGTEPEYTGPKAVCLPSFLIIGAQKSGTDELAVWLNRNKYNRRMDGGVETHFFDCMGRGLGGDRFSCDRKRSFLMTDHQTENRLVLLPGMNKTSPSAFSWHLERLKSPFMDDQIWRQYMRLGHLNNRRYHLEPSRTLIFEKTPSYLDMADPRDVVRLLPRGKFVILTRDPVARLVSSYYQFCDSPGNTEGPCSMEEFTTLALEAVSGKLDVTTPDLTLKRRQGFARAVRHGQYAELLENWTKYFWVDETMPDKQFLVVDQHHFRGVPLSVLHAVEGFTGNRGPIRHYKYKPHYKNGYYVLGDYSKAFHPTHRDPMPDHVQEALREFYRPSILKFRKMLEKKSSPFLFGCPPGEEFPSEDLQDHPLFFAERNRFQYPPWIRNVTSDESPRA